jgi:hypothetical protein
MKGSQTDQEYTLGVKYTLADMEPILSSDTPQVAYPKMNRNFNRLNQEIAGIKESMVIASYYGVDASCGDRGGI